MVIYLLSPTTQGQGQAGCENVSTPMVKQLLNSLIDKPSKKRYTWGFGLLQDSGSLVL